MADEIETDPSAGGCLAGVVAMSTVPDNRRILQLHFNRDVTAEDRARLVRLHNAQATSHPAYQDLVEALKQARADVADPDKVTSIDDVLAKFDARILEGGL